MLGDQSISQGSPLTQDEIHDPRDSVGLPAVLDESPEWCSGNICYHSPLADLEKETASAKYRIICSSRARSVFGLATRFRFFWLVGIG